MATLKLKRPAAAPAQRAEPRPPVRTGAPRPRLTLAEAEAQRRQRDERRAAFAPPASPRRPEPPPRRDAAGPAAGQAPRRDAAGPAAGQAPRRDAFQRPSAGPRTPAPAFAASPLSAPPGVHAEGSLRLSKRMSELGLASRREADEWIARGWVRVDGEVVSELGSRVLPSQRVTIDARARGEQAGRVTVLVNKPVGYVSGQAEDGYEPAVVLVTPDNQWQGDDSGIHFSRRHLHSLVPAGRLDIDSVGLLVLTQDGRVARQLIGEDSEIEKEYLVRVTRRDDAPGDLASVDLAPLRHGLSLDGEALRPATVEWQNADQLRFVLRQGKKRQIRRMCEAVGLQVTGLKRVRIGAVMLGDLPPGCWRYLRPGETFA